MQFKVSNLIDVIGKCRIKKNSSYFFKGALKRESSSGGVNCHDWDMLSIYLEEAWAYIILYNYLNLRITSLTNYARLDDHKKCYFELITFSFLLNIFNLYLIL